MPVWIGRGEHGLGPAATAEGNLGNARRHLDRALELLDRIDQQQTEILRAELSALG
jgi:hypothetical protein